MWYLPCRQNILENSTALWQTKASSTYAIYCRFHRGERSPSSTAKECSGTEDCFEINAGEREELVYSTLWMLGSKQSHLRLMSRQKPDETEIGSITLHYKQLNHNNCSSNILFTNEASSFKISQPPSWPMLHLPRGISRPGNASRQVKHRLTWRFNLFNQSLPAAHCLSVSDVHVTSTVSSCTPLNKHSGPCSSINIQCTLRPCSSINIQCTLNKHSGPCHQSIFSVLSTNTQDLVHQSIFSVLSTNTQDLVINQYSVYSQQTLRTLFINQYSVYSQQTLRTLSSINIQCTLNKHSGPCWPINIQCTLNKHSGPCHQSIFSVLSTNTQDLADQSIFSRCTVICNSLKS